jgi:hypothetical protein
MGKIKATARKAIGKTKEAGAEILGDGKLQEEAKAEQHKAEEEDNERGNLKPFGNLDRLT